MHAVHLSVHCACHWIQFKLFLGFLEDFNLVICVSPSYSPCNTMFLPSCSLSLLWGACSKKSFLMAMTSHLPPTTACWLSDLYWPPEALHAHLRHCSLHKFTTSPHHKHLMSFTLDYIIALSKYYQNAFEFQAWEIWCAPILLLFHPSILQFPNDHLELCLSLLEVMKKLPSCWVWWTCFWAQGQSTKTPHWLHWLLCHNTLHGHQPNNESYQQMLCLVVFLLPKVFWVLASWCQTTQGTI